MWKKKNRKTKEEIEKRRKQTKKKRDRGEKEGETRQNNKAFKEEM